MFELSQAKAELESSGSLPESKGKSIVNVQLNLLFFYFCLLWDGECWNCAPNVWFMSEDVMLHLLRERKAV